LRSEDIVRAGYIWENHMTDFTTRLSRYFVILLLVSFSLLAGIFVNVFLYYGSLNILPSRIATTINFLAPIPLMWLGIYILTKNMISINKMQLHYKFSMPINWLFVKHYMIASFAIGMILCYQQVLADLP
jgi:hypothetical protein